MSQGGKPDVLRCLETMDFYNRQEALLMTFQGEKSTDEADD